MAKKIPGYCALCISRCGCLSTVEDDRLLSVTPLQGHPTGHSFCIKGRAAPELVHSPERILTPLKRTRPKGAEDPGWQPISWDEALGEISRKLLDIKSSSGAEAVSFGVTTPSGTGISDSFVWINRLAHAFGSPNTLFATENCNWHKDFVPRYTHGEGIGMPDYEQTGCIILWGFNPATSWPAQAELITRAIKRGARLLVVDPRGAGLARRADEWLQLKPASDGPLAMALAHQLISNGWFDAAFMRDWSNGPLLLDSSTNTLLRASLLGPEYSEQHFLAWDTEHARPVVYNPDTGTYSPKPGELALFGEFELALPNSDPRSPKRTLCCRPVFQHYADHCSQYTPEHAATITGISPQQLMDCARLIHRSGPLSYFTWTGTAHQHEATQCGRAIALLYALTGAIDAPGGNCYFSKPPVENMLGLDLLSETQRSRTLGLEQRPLGPATMGWITSVDLYKSITRAIPYRTRALVSFGGNPLLTKPNAASAAQALRQLEFYLHIDMFINPSAKDADIILPAASPWERPGLYPGFQISQQAESRLQLRPPVIPPRGESRSDSWIVFELATRLGLKEHFFGGNMQSAIEHMIAPSGISLEQLQAAPEGITLPLESSYQKYRQLGFATPSKKLEIFSEVFQQHGYSPIPQFSKPAPVDKRYPLRLICAKWSLYCHSQQRQLPSLLRRMPEPLVEINPQLATRLGVSEHDWVVLETPAGQIQARAKFKPTLAEDVVCSQYGWWSKTQESYNNLVTDRAFDPISGSNHLRDLFCRIFRAPDSTSSS